MGSRKPKAGAPQEGAPTQQHGSQKTQGRVAANVRALTEWCKSLALDPPRGLNAVRVALLLASAQGGELRGREIRETLEISPQSLRRAGDELGDRVERSGHRWRVTLQSVEEAALGRVGAALRTAGLEEAAAVWAPAWQRDHPIRFAELAALRSASLEAGATVLRETLRKRGPDGVRRDWALEWFGDGCVIGQQLDLTLPDTVPPGLNGHNGHNGHNAPLVQLVAIAPGRWTAEHARRVVAAAGLPDGVAIALEEARDVWAASLTPAEWAREAAPRTLAFLEQRAQEVAP